MAAGGGEDRDAPGGLAWKATVPWGPSSPDEGSPLRHSNILHVGFSDACKGVETPRGCHAKFSLARGRLCQGGALVAWSSVCRPFADGGLGIRHLHHANSTLLRKWVVRVMQPSKDLISRLLREAYGSTLDWGEWATPPRGDSP